MTNPRQRQEQELIKIKAKSSKAKKLLKTANRTYKVIVVLLEVTVIAMAVLGEVMAVKEAKAE